MTLFQGSRYETTPLFERAENGRLVFRGLRARPVDKAQGVLEYRIKAGDRLDRLAHHFHGDSRTWHRLAEANPHVLFPEDLLPTPPDPRTTDGEARDDPRLGRTILIPRKREG